MLETSARLLRLLSLLQVRRDWSGADLADRLEVGVRTVRRDIDKLRSLGYPVHASPGVAGGYRLGAGAALPPLLLDDDEAVAVAVGLRTAANGTVAGIEETSLRALAKLEQVLPTRLRHRVHALHSVTVPLVNHGPTVDPDTLTVIASACRDHDRLRFGYRSHHGTATRRTVEPHRLVHTGRRWYLLAWDGERGDWRTFRVDRIDPDLSVGLRFAARDLSDDEVAAHVARGVTTAAYSHAAEVRLHASAEWVAERVWPTVAVVERIDERTCLVRTGAESLEVLALLVAQIGAEFDILDPPELAEHVRVLAARLSRAAG